MPLAALKKFRAKAAVQQKLLGLLGLPGSLQRSRLFFALKKESSLVSHSNHAMRGDVAILPFEIQQWPRRNSLFG